MTEECNNALADNVSCNELVINGTSYFIGFCKKTDVRQVFLTNFTEYYEEILSNDNAIKRCEELNPLLVEFDLEDTLDELMVNIPKYIVSFSYKTIKLKYKIDGGWFCFEIYLTKGNLEKFYKSFADVIFSSIFELKRRYNCLLDIVKRKDKEIEEYKAQGLKIPRESLITGMFTEKLFQENLKSTNQVNKIEVFTEIMKFHNSIKVFKNEVNLKSESVSSSDENISLSKQEKIIKSKRPASSDIRCAITTGIEKKTKVPKQAPEMKFL